VETVRWIFEQLFGGRRVDPELLAPDVEWVNPAEAVEPGTRRGPEEFNRAVANVFAAWDDVRFETERVIGNGDDVVALGQQFGDEPGSDVAGGPGDQSSH